MYKAQEAKSKVFALSKQHNRNYDKISTIFHESFTEGLPFVGCLESRICHWEEWSHFRSKIDFQRQNTLAWTISVYTHVQFDYVSRTKASTKTVKKKRHGHKVLNFSVCAKKCGLRPENWAWVYQNGVWWNHFHHDPNISIIFSFPWNVFERF